ncbi:hypothetical protein DPMN_058584 [Dreissena polymorpha]|uniref:Uncharacterized protein n=1 Tax=Dreissena polymorpha TaxID=45954 RepID=A0A9D4C2A7_DREPO|nr:hypothetical protein DPMN_058584 [Dreissena polymorpha]
MKSIGRKLAWLGNQFLKAELTIPSDNVAMCVGFTLHKLGNMRRTGAGKPRSLLDQEKLDLFRGPDQMRSCTRRTAQRP